LSGYKGIFVFQWYKILKRKLFVHDTGTNEWMRPHLSRGMCGDVLLSNAISWHLFGSVAASFFSWWNACQWKMSGLSLVDIFLIPSFHSPPLKVHIDPLCFVCFNLNLYSFYFYFFSWFFYKNFVCFEFSSSIIICHVFFFSIQSLFFWFLICILDIFVKVLLIFNFIF